MEVREWGGGAVEDDVRECEAGRWGDQCDGLVVDDFTPDRIAGIRYVFSLRCSRRSTFLDLGRTRPGSHDLGW